MHFFPRFPIWFALTLFLLSSPTVQAQELMDLLKKGPVVLIESNKQGKFHSAMAVAHVHAERDKVWQVATDFAHYKDFMPNLLLSETEVKSPENIAVTFEVDVPGLNPEYTFNYQIDHKGYRMTARWLKGDLKDSFVKWRLVEGKSGGTVVYYTTASRNFSSMAEALENEEQTITIGVNVTAALASIKAVKLKAEGKK